MHWRSELLSKTSGLNVLRRALGTDCLFYVQKDRAGVFYGELSCGAPVCFTEHINCEHSSYVLACMPWRTVTRLHQQWRMCESGMWDSSPNDE